MISSPIAVSPVTPLAVPQTAEVASSGPGFDSVLRSAIQNVQNSAVASGNLMESFLSGDTQDLHTVAIASQKASLQLETLLQVRNRLVQAYQEVMRMQL